MHAHSYFWPHIVSSYFVACSRRGVSRCQHCSAVASRSRSKIPSSLNSALATEAPHAVPQTHQICSHHRGFALVVCSACIWSHHFMTNKWGNNGNRLFLLEMEMDFIFLGSKTTADGDCNHEIKRHLLLGRKTITNLDSILKSRGITLPTKVHIVKAMGFPVVMYGCESWTIKKAEH